LAGASLLAGRGIFITGARGFLGSHLSRALTAAGAAVHAFTGDVTSLDSLRTEIAAARPDVIFHLAAYGTTARHRDVARMRDVNVGGVEKLWAAFDSFRGRLIQTGSCAEYAPKDGALTEDDPCVPDSEYATSLHDAVMYSQSMAARSGRELVVLRPFGPYGPGDRPERLIPFVIDGLLGHGRVAVTAGRQRRDFSYVSDHVAALLSAATAPLAGTGRAYNIGSGHPITVREIVATIADLIGDRAADRIDYGAVPARPDDRADRYADIGRAARDLGFVPSVTLLDGLRMTIAAARASRQEAVR